MLRMLKDMDYRTRRLKAGDLCEPLSREDADLLKQVGFAEEVVEETVPATAPKRRGRPPRHAAAEAPPKEEPKPEPPKPQPAMSKQEETKELEDKAALEPEAKLEPEILEEKTRPQLKKIAEEKGVELPRGYVSKDDLVDLVVAADDDDGA